MDDREIIQWDKRLTDQARRGWDNYKHLHIDLTTARLDQSYLIAGEYLYVEESSSIDAVAKIKLNGKNNDALDLERGVKIETVFIEVFITNDALEGEKWLDLVFGINFKYKKKILDMILVDRGDPVISDFILADFTADGLWHELDLTGIIPNNTYGIIIAIEFSNTNANKEFRIRKEGNVNDANALRGFSQAANTRNYVEGTVFCDTNNRIEYYIQAGGWLTFYLRVIGWFV